MDAVAKIIGGGALIVGGVFFVIIFATLMGGVAGWVVGLVFTDTIATLKQALGLEVTNFQLGAMLGFVGGFFRSASSSSSKD